MEKTKHTNNKMTGPKPIPPSPEDCCGQGCVPCVNDIYETELRLWENECKQLELESKPTETPNKLICRDSYTSFKIKEIIPLTNDTFIYQFELPYATARLLPNNLAIGQHLILRLVLENHSDVDEDQIQVTGGSITRQYTILSSPTAQGYFDIMIKLYKDGIASQMIRRWKVGDIAEFRGPFGEFAERFLTSSGKLNRTEFGHVVMLVAGTGIAPMIQLIKSLLDDEDCDIKLQLLCSFRTSSDILLEKELRGFAEFWNFKISYFISQSNVELPAIPPVKFHYANIIQKRINNEILSEYFASHKIDLKLPKNLFLVCGTKSYESQILEYLRNSQVPANCLFKF